MVSYKMRWEIRKYNYFAVIKSDFEVFVLLLSPYPFEFYFLLFKRKKKSTCYSSRHYSTTFHYNRILVVIR